MPTTLPDPTGKTPYTLGQIIGNPEHSLGIYLAKNGMDVWGIDWRWALIPFNPLNPLGNAPVPEFDEAGNMIDSGIMYLNTDTHLDDFEVTLKFARLTRLLTGQGYSKMYLTGHSLGAYMALALANRQAEYREFKRDIKGIIPVDFPFKSDNPLIQQTGCDRVAGYDWIMAGNRGVYPPLNNPEIMPPVFNTTGLTFI
jgi:pimeloyl-ACP methyl ester carboxylesterase